MEYQGKPIGNTPTGTKNTSTPAPPVQEGPGAIAKDSLAAESSAYPDQYTQDVSGSNSTFNNTDTSGATTLPPTSNSSARPDGSLGGASFGGTTSDQGYSGGPSSERSGGPGVYETGLGSSGHTSGSNGEPAPSYVQDLYLQDKASGKPKGNNITEGGFNDDAPNASFTTDIGSKNDPGRAGISQLQKQSMGDAADAGLPKTQKGLDTDHPYQTLNTDESA